MKELKYNGKTVGIEEIQPQLREGFALVTCTGEGSEKRGKRYIKSLRTELCYDERTPREVIDVLEKCFADRTRVILDYGKDGQSWGEVNDIKGRIGRSTGVIKIPLLIHNARSMGGGALLDHCIVKITTSAGGHVLYQHPQYKPFQFAA